MASPVQVEFLKVLACIAWADEELTTGEINFIKKFVRQFDLSGEEWTQVEMYLDERVGPEETKRVTRRFLSRVARPKERRMLAEAVRHLLESDGKLTEAKRGWLRGLDELVSETKGNLYLMDGLKSLLRLGGKGKEPFHDGREADVHDFIHNRVLFRLRRRLGARRLEEEGTPEKLKKLTLSATLLAQVGYVDQKFAPQEEKLITEILCDMWDASTDIARTISQIAMTTAHRSLDRHRLSQEVRTMMSHPERRRVVEAMFALARAEGHMSHEEIEEIRRIAYGLELSHKEFIDAKVGILDH